MGTSLEVIAKLSSKSTTNALRFAQQISYQVQQTQHVLSTRQLCSRDFEVLVDTNGYFYHYNLVRCVSNGSNEYSHDLNHAMEYLQKINETAWSVVHQKDRLTATTLLDSINTTSPRYCGWFKCYFSSKATPTTSGYLLMSAKTEGEYQNVLQAWKLARRLSREYGAQQLFRGSPYRISVRNPTTIKALKDTPLQTENGGRFNAQYPLIVQEVWTAPPHQVIKFYHPFIAKYGQATNATEIIENLAQDAIVSHSFVAARLLNDIDRTQQMIRNEALCVYDFQVLLDYTGNLYHIDLDRCFETNEPPAAPQAHADALLTFLEDLKLIARQTLLPSWKN